MSSIFNKPLDWQLKTWAENSSALRWMITILKPPGIAYWRKTMKSEIDKLFEEMESDIAKLKWTLIASGVAILGFSLILLVSL